MGDIVFADGLRAFRPKEKAPAHIKAKLTIARGEFSRWLAAQRVDERDEVRLEVCASKAGKYYARVDSYRPAARQPDPPPPADDPNHPREPARATAPAEHNEEMPF